MPQASSLKEPGFQDCGPNSSDHAVVLMSRRPACKHHVVIVPYAHTHRPHVLDEDAFLIGLAFATRASPRMWLSFDSGGGGALAQHLHWHGFFPGSSSTATFPLDQHLQGKRGRAQAAVPRGPISLWCTQAWPLRGWIFTWEDAAVLGIDTGLAERRLAEFVHSFVVRLQDKGLAHNVLVSSGGTQVVVFPYRASSHEGGACVGCPEVTGHELLGWWMVPGNEDFVSLEEASAVACLSSVALQAESEAHTLEALRSAGWQLTDAALSLPNLSPTAILE